MLCYDGRNATQKAQQLGVLVCLFQKCLNRTLHTCQVLCLLVVMRCRILSVETEAQNTIVWAVSAHAYLGSCGFFDPLLPNIGKYSAITSISNFLCFSSIPSPLLLPNIRAFVYLIILLSSSELSSFILSYFLFFLDIL